MCVFGCLFRIGDIFLACEDFGEGSVSHSLLDFFFLRWRLAHDACQFHSLGQDQSTVAQRAEVSVDKCSLMWHVNLFP